MKVSFTKLRNYHDYHYCTQHSTHVQTGLKDKSYFRISTNSSSLYTIVLCNLYENPQCHFCCGASWCFPCILLIADYGFFVCAFQAIYYFMHLFSCWTIKHRKYDLFDMVCFVTYRVPDKLWSLHVACRRTYI